MKKIYILKKYNKSGFPKNWLFFDVETLIDKYNDELKIHNFRLGCVLYWEIRKNRDKDTIEKMRFKDIDKFWKFVFSKVRDKCPLNIVSHNISYDFRVVRGFKYMKDNGFRLKKFLTNNLVNIWTFVKDKKKIRVLDSLNYFNVSLETLGKNLGIEKLEMPFWSESDEKWFEYCERDVKILYYAFKKLNDLLETNDFGKFTGTIASQSLMIYRKRFNNEQIKIFNSQPIDDFERKAYYGGRTECFYIGVLNNDEYFKLDVNGVYPFVMRDNYLPTQIVGVYDYLNISELKKILENNLIISRVKVETPEPCFPLRYNNKLIFPIGEFETYLPTPEIEFGLEKGYIKEIFETIVYKKEKIFKEFIEELWNLRNKYKEEGNIAFSFFTKILMNSLYGKFGQLNDIWEYIGIDDSLDYGSWREYDLDDEKMIYYRCIDGVVEIKANKIRSFHTFVSIPAHITSYARIYLLKLINIAGRENVYYCDTDSLFTNREGFENLKNFISEKELGKIKVEKISNYLEIRNLKDYKFGEEIKIKGIKKTAKEIDENTFIQEQFINLRTGLRMGDINNVYSKELRKVLKRNYDKGIITEEGYIKPFKLCLPSN